MSLAYGECAEPVVAADTLYVANIHLIQWSARVALSDPSSGSAAELRRCATCVQLQLRHAVIITNMSKGRSNKLAGQIGEYLVCAELGKRGLIATPFSGNVPAFDVLAADDLCRTVPIQVKASRSDNWPSDARDWMQIALDPVTKAQENLGPVTIQNPHLIYVFVAIAPPGSGRDRFFILTKAQLQLVCINMYSAWMDKLEWKRPRNPASYDCRHRMSDMQQYENNWQLITDTLATTRFSQSLESTEE